MKLKGITTFPLNGPAPNILRFCGSIANGNGKYYITITWPDALLSFEIVNPGTALKKVLDNSLKPNKPKFRRRPVCLSGVVKPPAVGNVLPTIEDTRVAQLDIESDNRFVGALVLATVSATAISVTTAVIVDSGGGGVVSPTRP
ncbi:MAG: hypothetical protein M3Y27_26600 [Acidobacteriota bacterium]|nr:hypothetical protein [Acidobacteriota bacterium]